MEIVEKLEKDKRKVRFEDGSEVEVFVNAIRTGGIKNPYHPSVCEAGYFGVGEYRANMNGKNTPEYTVWTSMLQRCYDEKRQERHPAYKGVTICKEWHNFQNFADFYHKNLPKIDNIQFHLDKDLLQEGIGNKVYSQNTCIFLPQSVNKFLTNKQSNNTSGYIGVCWDKRGKKWVSGIKVFGEGKLKGLGYFKTPEIASKAYQSARAIESEKVKDYLRSLNYLSEEVIQLVK